MKYMYYMYYRCATMALHRAGAKESSPICLCTDHSTGGKCIQARQRDPARKEREKREKREKRREACCCGNADYALPVVECIWIPCRS